MARHRLRFAAALLFMVTVQAHPAAGQTLPFVLDAGLPLLQARIDGREARLLIDTGGAAALALRPEWAPVTEGAASTSQDAQGQLRLNAKLAVAEITLAGQRLSPTPPAQTWGKTRRPAGADGYLGWGWLRAQRWVLDYGTRQLQLLTADEPMPANCGTAPLGLDMLGSLPVLRLTDGGRPDADARAGQRRLAKRRPPGAGRVRGWRRAAGRRPRATSW